MDTMLDESFDSQINTMKIVEQLSDDIVHMQKNMNDMQQLLCSLVENQEVVSYVITHMHVSMRTYMYIYPIMYTYACIHMHTCDTYARMAYIHTYPHYKYTHAYLYTHARAYTHAHTNT